MQAFKQVTKNYHQKMSPNSKILFELEKIWYLNIRTEYLIQIEDTGNQIPNLNHNDPHSFLNFRILLRTEKRKFWKLFICMSSVITACILFSKAHNG